MLLTDEVITGGDEGDQLSPTHTSADVIDSGGVVSDPNSPNKLFNLTSSSNHIEELNAIELEEKVIAAVVNNKNTNSICDINKAVAKWQQPNGSASFVKEGPKHHDLLTSTSAGTKASLIFIGPS